MLSSPCHKETCASGYLLRMVCQLPKQSITLAAKCCPRRLVLTATPRNRRREKNSLKIMLST